MRTGPTCTVAVWAAEGREVSELAGLCACYDLRCLIGRGR
jgi:hypothetical protein